MKNLYPFLLRSVSRAVLVALIFPLSFGLTMAMEPPPAFLMEWGSRGVGEGQFYYPYRVAVDSVGNVYVADTYNHRMQQFDTNGNFLIQWGSFGMGDGQFYYAFGVVVDVTDNVYSADASNHRIQKFDIQGNFLTKWGSRGAGKGQFSFPRSVAVDSAGNVYAADTNNHRMQKFDSDGNFLTRWGSSGVGEGQFYYPYGVAVDSVGNVYVADTYNHRMQKFDSDGNFLTMWGSSGVGEGQFYYPSGVAVDSAGNVYVADTYNHRIQKFGEENFDEPTIHVTIDIKPGSHKNPLNLRSRGVLPIAILGTESLDVTTIDPATIVLTSDGAGERTGEGVVPIRWRYGDVSTPSEEELADDDEVGPDGHMDLTLKFKMLTVVEEIGDVNDSDEIFLTITGYLVDGAQFEGKDFVTILKKGKEKNKKNKEKKRGRGKK